MGRKRWWLLAVAMGWWLTSCGGGAVGTTVTTAPGTTTATTTTTTASTTTRASTTTAASTTTVQSEQHPAWPASWATLWPADGSTAAVRAVAPEGAIDAVVGMDYDLAWDGGTWDRIWLGSPQTDQLGVSFYLQRPEPWVVVLWGAETYAGSGLYMTERFDPPVSLDLRLLPDEAISAETTLVITDFGGDVEEGPYALTLSFVGFEEVTVPAGTFANTVHLHLAAEEPGGFVAETDLWIDSEQALVRLAPAHIWQSLELAERWSG